MVHGLPAVACRLNGHGQIFFDFGLPDELAQPLRPQLKFERRIIPDRGGRNKALAVRIWIRIISGGSHWPDITMPWTHGPYVQTGVNGSRP